jgi:hypothetical protein
MLFRFWCPVFYKSIFCSTGEGKAAIFEREEIKFFLPDDDKASLIKKLDPRKVVESPSRSRSPRARESRDSKRENVKEKDLRDRLGKPNFLMWWWYLPTNSPENIKNHLWYFFNVCCAQFLLKIGII